MTDKRAFRKLGTSLVRRDADKPDKGNDLGSGKNYGQLLPNLTRSQSLGFYAALSERWIWSISLIDSGIY